MTKADKEGQRKAPILRFKGFTDDWEQRQLGEIGTTYSGLSGKNKSDFEKGNSNFVTFLEVLNNPVLKNIDLTNKVEIKENEHQNKVKRNDILFNTSSETPEEVATSTVVDVNQSNLYLNSFCFGFRPNVQFSNYYIGYYLRSNHFRNRVFCLAQGISRYNISKKSLIKLKLSLPKLEEQDKIGKIFNQVELLLTLYAKKSSCLDSCIAYFIRILYDDPQFFKQKNVQNSIIKSFKLDDILIKNNAKNKDLSILNVESISNKKGFISQKEQFDNYRVASKDLSNYYVIRPKDFAYNPSRINVGSIAYKNPNEIKGIVSPLYVSFKCNNDIVLDKYLWYWFKSTNFEHQRVRLSEGGVRDTLSFNQLSKMKISIPSFEIQRQTINLLEILIQYKEEVDLKLNNLKLIKNTLLQNMFL